jgi:hypothetical protein
MCVRPIVVGVAMTCAFSASAGAFVLVVEDPINIAQHIALNGWREVIDSVLTRQVAKIGHMAQRLSLFTSLAKYVAPDAPAWRTRRIVPALPASDAFMAAINGGDSTGEGYAAVARQRVAVGDLFARFGDDDDAAENAVRSALATLDIAGSAIIVGTDQTGRIRGNRHHEEEMIQALEDDVVDPDAEQSTTAVLDKISAASLIRARQQETRMQLLTALAEQLLVDSRPSRGGKSPGRLSGRFPLVASTVVSSGERECLQNRA